MPSKNSGNALSPGLSLFCGHIFMGVIIGAFCGFGLLQDNTYFTWGPPITFFSRQITDSTTFYTLLMLTFFHQIITNWIAEVIYPWVINTIQNPKVDVLDYSKATCLTIINFNSLYNQLHLAYLISGITSQVSFLAVLVLADLITLTYVNWHYMIGKTVRVTEKERRVPPKARIPLESIAVIAV